MTKGDVEFKREAVPSVPIRAIRKLPFGRRLALRLYNRLLMHLAPRHRVETFFGASIDCDVRDQIQATIIHFRAWEPTSSLILSRLVKPGDVAVDVGANIGYYSLLFSSLAGERGKVVAIEASPSIAAALEHNLRLNGTTNVRVVNAAVAGERGTCTVYEAPRTNIGMTTTLADRGYPAAATVDAFPLLDILSDDEAKRTTLIKIDIEGAEPPVVAEILANLDRFAERLAISVEADVAKNPEWAGLFQGFLDRGFKAYDLGSQYDWMALMDGSQAQPRLLDSVPPTQADILFTKAELSRAARLPR